jgi:hypothetical protein
MITGPSIYAQPAALTPDFRNKVHPCGRRTDAEPDRTREACKWAHQFGAARFVLHIDVVVSLALSSGLRGLQCCLLGLSTQPPPLRTDFHASSMLRQPPDLSDFLCALSYGG